MNKTTEKKSYHGNGILNIMIGVADESWLKMLS
jgi:hypothetical protein